MIEKVKALSKGYQEIFLAYLHFLHMLEHLDPAHHDPQNNYRNYQYHWVRTPLPSPSGERRWGGAGGGAHWVR